MAHDIDTMFYYGERPWHGLGVELKKVATSAEAMTAAKLNWKIDLEPIFLKSGKPCTGFQATVRADTRTPLGIVRMRYQPIQNTDGFSFFDAVVGHGKAMYHTAGALGRGERVWILAKLPGDLIVSRRSTKEATEKFLLFTNNHDACGSARMFYTPVRVVCQNTLNMALSTTGGREGIAIRHTGQIKSKVADAQKLLGLATKYYDDFGQLAHTLVSKDLTQQMIRNYVHSVFPTDKKDPSARLENIRSVATHFIDQGKGNTASGIHGTAWAALNGVIEYVDHSRTPRGDTKEQQASSRLESVWFGSGADIKARAWDAALALVK